MLILLRFFLIFLNFNSMDEFLRDIDFEEEGEMKGVCKLRDRI